MGMSKRSLKVNKNSSEEQEQVFEVQKIVNQRIINGKKQYKVIWVGYSFQEATWEPQANLQCPQKIEEFLKRYQDVIRRKMANKQLNTPNQPPQSIPKTNIGNKTTYSNEAKEQKPNINNHNSASKPKIFQSTIKNPQTAKNQFSPLKKQVEQNNISKSKPKEFDGNQILNDKNLKQSNLAANGNKIIQIKQHSTNNQHISTLNQAPLMNGSKKQFHNSITQPRQSGRNEKIIEQNTEQSSQQGHHVGQSQKRKNIYLQVHKRLDIDQILGIIQFQQLQNPLFFVIKNKYSEQEKLVSRQRIIGQESHKLIQFYQAMIENQQII